MSERPTYTTPVGSKFSFHLPPNWFAMITSLARKNYDQGMLVAFDYYGEPNTTMFHNPSGNKDKQMEITVSGQNSYPMVPQDDPMDISVEFFYSVNKVSDADDLVEKKATASKIHVVKAEKTPGSFLGADTMTLFVFVEDTPMGSQSPTTSGSYDDAVGFIHLLKED